MTILQGAALVLAGLLAGALNSVAGGGSSISFPTLLFVGVPVLSANATNAAAVLPGSIASIPAYRKDLGHEKRDALIFSAISAVGGLLGALLLARTPPAVFKLMIPFLLLLATLVFAFGGQITAAVRRKRSSAAASTVNDAEKPVSTGTLVTVLCFQFFIALYGGFFGAGIGIMMLAGLALLGSTNIHAMNALKVVLASVTNAVAVIAFALLHLIYWPQMLVMAVGAIAGGWGGATLAHYVPQRAVRWFVIVVGGCTSIYFFYTYYILKP
jgi:uncharacterized protein